LNFLSAIPLREVGGAVEQGTSSAGNALEAIRVGIIGEYLGGIHFGLMDEPSCTVRRIYSGRTGPAS